ncbi:MAG: hypothetical protein QXI33_02475 [Candidatus Pacearchaeota archaeon]
MGAIDKLRFKEQDITLYKAGLPDFPRNFTRDAIISAILMQDKNMLKDQLIYCARLQGTKKDNLTGEEPGKIFHEFPGVLLNGRYTTFNACDTNALFLIGHEIYLKLSGDYSLLESQKQSIINSVKYIKLHIKNGGFFEDPKFSGADEFALKVTYWKDSVIIDRENGIPKYPVIYSLAHVQNMRAIKSAYYLLKDISLLRLYYNMREFFNKTLFDNKDNFINTVDAYGPIKSISSDMLHILFYLSKEDINKTKINKIVENSNLLETEYGYRTLNFKDAEKIQDKYHTSSVWPFEQALINIGAKKFNLIRVEEISYRVFQYLDTNPELFHLNGRIKKSGCDPQLWTIAAKYYFKNKKGVFP